MRKSCVIVHEEPNAVLSSNVSFYGDKVSIRIITVCKALVEIFALSDRCISSDGVTYVDASHTFSGSSYRLIWSDVSHLIACWVCTTEIDVPMIAHRLRCSCTLVRMRRMRILVRRVRRHWR